MFNLILFGPPGSGKGTQSEKLTAEYNLKHLSTGDLLRSEIHNQTPLGIEAKKIMDKGHLVPDEVVIGMISSALDSNPKCDGFLFDGFPRTSAQAEALDKLLDLKKAPIAAMLALEVNEQYHRKTAPVADHYKQAGKVVIVKGEGSVDEIFAALCKGIDSRINAKA
jgi:adenylate kinase